MSNNDRRAGTVPGNTQIKKVMKIQVIKNGQQVGEIKVINNMAVIDGIIEFNVQDERYISFISALKNNGYILR